MNQNKKKKHLLFYLINFFIVIIVSMLTLNKIINENGLDTIMYLKDISFFSIVVLTIMFFVNYYLEGIIISLSLKEYDENFKPQYGFVVQCVGGLFSAITPLKLGYYPGLGYAYSRFNVKVDNSLKSMAKNSFSYQILILLMCVFSLIVCLYKPMIVDIGDNSLDLKYVALIGLAYNSILMIGYFVLVLFPPIHNLILKTLSCFLYKIKKIDDREIYFEEKKEKMEFTRMQIIKYFKNYKESAIIFLIYLFKYIFFTSMPYVIYLLLTKEHFYVNLFVYTIVLNNLISYIVSFIPIPGASGAIEVVFIAVFSLIYSPVNLLTSILLVWRMFSYFINIIVGLIVFAILLNIKRKRVSN